MSDGAEGSAIAVIDERFVCPKPKLRDIVRYRPKRHTWDSPEVTPDEADRVRRWRDVPIDERLHVSLELMRLAERMGHLPRKSSMFPGWKNLVRAQEINDDSASAS